MPVPYSAANLKSRFNTGDKPAQLDFADLIDTVESLLVVSQQTAAAASAVAAAAIAAAHKLTLFAGAWNFPFGSGNVVLTQNLNVATVVVIGSALRFNFAAPYGNAAYLTLVSSLIGATGAPVQAASYWQVNWTDGGGVLSNRRFSVLLIGGS